MSVTSYLSSIRSSISASSHRVGRGIPRLVAVSKTKPMEAVLEAYAADQRHFGENYVQELLEKAPLCPPDIMWHFIGQLQSNKARALVLGVPNLWAVESVDSIKLANLLNKARAEVIHATLKAPSASNTSSSSSRASPKASSGGGSSSSSSSPKASTGGVSAASPPPALPWTTAPLRVFVQVNTSAEAQKGGTEPGLETLTLAKHIAENCPALYLAGLMTVGKIGETSADCFLQLVEERNAILKALGREVGSLSLSAAAASSGSAAAASSSVPPFDAAAPLDAVLCQELSMGMSDDMELAIETGSTNIRVGSKIFGSRVYASSKPAASTEGGGADVTPALETLSLNSAAATTSSSSNSSATKTD